MNKHFDQIEGLDWMTKQDRDDFARYCYVYTKNIESMFGQYNWDNEEFIHFCKTNNIQKKGNKIGGKNKNHFWFNPNRSLEKVSCHFLMTAIRKIALYMLDS